MDKFFIYLAGGLSVILAFLFSYSIVELFHNWSKLHSDHDDDDSDTIGG